MGQQPTPIAGKMNKHWLVALCHHHLAMTFAPSRESRYFLFLQQDCAPKNININIIRIIYIYFCII
jgi:hypothetical protein